MKNFMGLCLLLTVSVLTILAPSKSQANVHHYCVSQSVEGDFYNFFCLLWVTNEPDIPGITDVKEVMTYQGDVFYHPQGGLYQTTGIGEKEVEDDINRLAGTVVGTGCSNPGVPPSCIEMNAYAYNENGALRNVGSQFFKWDRLCITGKTWYKFGGVWYYDPQYDWPVVNGCFLLTP